MKKSSFLFSSLIFLSLAGCVNQQNNSSEFSELSPGIPYPDDGTLPSSNTSTTSIIKHRLVKEDIYTAPHETHPEVIRYDRYTLVSDVANSGQKYLLEQMVNVNMKKRGRLTVEQGIWNTLENTGFSLCNPTDPDVKQLFGLSLPRVHYKFGPVKLRDALQMLAGEAYELSLNDAHRQICYKRRATLPEKPPVPKYVGQNTIEM